MSSSQLTNSIIFQDGVFPLAQHQPDRNIMGKSAGRIDFWKGKSLDFMGISLGDDEILGTEMEKTWGGNSFMFVIFFPWEIMF